MSVALIPCSTWDPWFVAVLREHYTESGGAPPGRKLGWFIFDHGVRRGIIGLGEPPYKLAARRRLGLEDARPLPGTVCCFIYRLELGGATPASVILKQWHDLAAEQWKRRYGEDVEHWETMCDPSHGEDVTGYCFRRAGYRSLGMTTGRSARRPAGSTRGSRVWSDSDPKLVLYRGPLARLPRQEQSVPRP